MLSIFNVVSRHTCKTHLVRYCQPIRIYCTGIIMLSNKLLMLCYISSAPISNLQPPTLVSHPSH